MTRLFNILFFLIIAGSFSAVAQIDNQGSSTAIPAIEKEEGSTSESLFDIKPLNPSLSNPNDNKVNGMSVPKNSNLKTQEEEFSMFKKEKFGNPGELYQKRFDKLEDELDKIIEGKVVGDTTDQYLGDFITNDSIVKVVYKDFAYVDGDVIRVFVEGDVYVPQVTLTGTFRGFELNLVKGFNKIDFQALNQGLSPPNTAQLLILDMEGNVIASSMWNLAQGVKATIIVVRE